MYYFKRDIGDYHKKAGKLSMLEHGAYTLLMDACYDREEFPTLEQAYEWAWARNDNERAAVQFVLTRFFALVDGKYVQNRIAEELAKYHENANINKRIAKEREAKRKAQREQSVNEACTKRHQIINKELEITNQENTKAIARVPRFDAQAHLLSLGVDVSVANDFVALRKQKRAALTLTALAGIAKEAGKAGMTLQQALEISCARGWQSFKADWIQNDMGKRGDNKPDWAVEKENRIRAFAGDSAAKPQTQIIGNIIDITPQPKLIGG
jgi:uncharacterized protein YdaU (DUF1376 family)